jgi:hypothetical protein
MVDTELVRVADLAVGAVRKTVLEEIHRDTLISQAYLR